jgi:hypothetical protein
MANSLYPAFVRIEYHSAYAPHTMTIPTTQWTGPPTSAFTSGEFDQWDAGSIEADVMIQALVDSLKAMFNNDVVFDGYTIYRIQALGLDPEPVYSAALSQVGTNISTAWHKAVQLTMVWRTAEFGIFKIVLMDAAGDGTFGRTGNFSAISPFSVLHNLVVDPDNGWSGRDNARPNQALQLSLTLNEKLRRAYRLQ